MVMLLPMQRCSDVQAILSRLGMSPKQVLGPLGMGLDNACTCVNTALLSLLCPPCTCNVQGHSLPNSFLLP